MFETIGTLFAVALWGGAILMVVAGILLCIDKIIKGDGLDKVISILVLIAGAFTFFCVQKWLDSIVWSLLAAGVVLSSVAKKETTPPAPKEPGLVETFTDAYLEGYTQQKIIEEAVEKGIRNARK